MKGLVTVLVIILHLGLGEEEVELCDILKPEGQELLRQSLQQDNCIRGLEGVSTDQAQRAARLFHRDGFVMVKDVLTLEQTQRLRNTCERLAREILEKDPRRIGNRGPNRYSFGSASKTGHFMHEPDWAMLVDLPTLTPILNEIFGNDDYVVRGGGGDFTTPGSTYQPLHADLGNTWLPDAAPTEWSDSGRINIRDLPAFYVTTNFIVQNITWENGPIRQIPLTANNQRPIPSIQDEPTWMRRSTVCPATEGSVLIRDPRAWHGGTPNLSHVTRFLPNIEYYASWFRYHSNQQMSPSVPENIYREMSPLGRKQCKEILVPLDMEIEYGIKKDIIMYVGGDVYPCYPLVGATQQEMDEYNKTHGIKMFTRPASRDNFYGKQEVSTKVLSPQSKDEL